MNEELPIIQDTYDLIEELTEPQENLRAVILTVLPIEYLAVRTHLTVLREEVHLGRTIYERGNFVVDGQTCEVGIVKVDVGAGNAEAAIEAEWAIAHFKPDILFLVGIAEGIKDVAIGDVVAATKVYGYESGKGAEQLVARFELGQSAYSLVQQARAEARTGEWLRRLSDSPTSQPRVFVAPIVGGNKVIASKKSDVFNFVKASYDDAIAIQMDGFVFLSRVFAHSDIKAMVIQGISDLIQKKSTDNSVKGTEEERQKEAAQNASAFAFQLLANSISFDPEQPQDPPETLSIIRKSHRAQCFTEPAIQLDLMLIPGGTFMMGSPPNELGQYSSEEPQHKVTVSTFLMGRYPVTQAQWRAIATRTDLKVNRYLEPDPSDFKGDDRPVEQVSWYEAVEFCDRLSRLTQQTYRLPTEAEWEYACRAGTTTPFHFGETITTDLANYCGEEDALKPEEYPGHYGRGSRGEYRKSTTPVNYFHPLANAFGLCDMHGNVWEWCLDHWHDNYEGAPTYGSAWLTENDAANRISRGGSWDVAPRDCRAACRISNYNPDYHDITIGFRVVCEIRGL